MEVKFLGRPLAGRPITILLNERIYTTPSEAAIIEGDTEGKKFKVITKGGDIYEGELSQATSSSKVIKQACSSVEAFEVLEEDTKKWVDMNNKTSIKGKHTRLKGENEKLQRSLIVPIEAKLGPQELTKRAQVRESLKDMWYSTYGPPQQQTRYCPDHPATMAMRVSDRSYQCPLDGKVYSYIDGFKKQDGTEVPGGSVSQQTPDDPSFYASHPVYMFGKE